MTSLPSKHWTVIYDGLCPLCERFTFKLQSWDKQNLISFRPLQDSEIYKDFPQLSREKCENEIHTIDPEGQVWAGIHAIEKLSRLIPKIKTLSWMLGLPGGSFWGPKIYSFLSRNRHRFSSLCLGCKHTSS